MNSNEIMSNKDTEKIFNDVMTNLPEDMKLPTEQMNSMRSHFATMSKALQQPLEKMVQQSTREGEISSEVQSKFTADLIKVMMPYMQRMIDEIDNDTQH